MRLCFKSARITTPLWLAAVTTLSSAGEPEDRRGVVIRDKVIAGGPKDFMEVRHLVLEGSNEEIGRALGSIASERYGVRLDAGLDRLRTRVARRYIKQRYPALFDRMRGVAAAFSRQVDDDAWDFSALPYLTGSPGGCSVVYVPPGATADGHGIVSRNYEFTVGTIDDRWPKRGELPVNSRPYLIELHPRGGHASMALCAFDLLSGVLDGINAEGLTVAVLSDYELKPEHPIDPAEQGGIGLSELQVLRMLLDTCANVEEAKEALLMTKQYYTFIPQHYLVADRHGRSFVWEYSYAHNKEYIIENPDKPLITTNFSLHRHMEGNAPPSAKRAKGVCARYCTLAERIAGASGKLTTEFIKQTHRAVDCTMPAPLFGLAPPYRTLWHTLYIPEQRAIGVSFYLRDEADPARPGQTRIVRSDYLEFKLATSNAKGG
jgi:hypothetical protein